jgi:hypothetical protein
LQQVSNYFGNDADGDDEGDAASCGDEELDLDEFGEEADGFIISFLKSKRGNFQQRRRK